MTWWLEAGEDGSDRIDLMSGASGAAGYSVMSQGFDIVPDAEDPDRFQILSIPLLIKGSSKNDLFNKRRAILTKLSQASFNRQPGSGQPRVTIAIRFGDADTLVRWVIESGNLTRGNLTGIVSNTLGSMEEPAILQLRCWRGGIGERIDYGPFTVSGADPTLHINGVPGDLPGVLEVHVEDTSTNSVAVNRLIWACRSLPDMADGDFDPVLPFNTNDDSVPDTFTGGIATISATSTWQTIGSVSRAASVHDGGVFDVYCRLRDESVYVPAPSTISALATEAIGDVQFVQSNNSTGTTRTIDWPVATTAGNLLVLIVQGFGNVGTITASGWTSAVAHGTNPQTAIFYKANAASESGTVSVGVSSGGSATSKLTLMELRGIATTSPVDQTSVATNSSTTSGSTGTTSSTTQAYAYALAVFTLNSGATGSYIPSTPSGYTSLHGSILQRIARRILTSTGAQTATSTTSLSSTWRNALVVFKGALTSPATLSAGSYLVYVTAIDSNGNESAPSFADSATLPDTGALYVTWDAVPSAASFRVYTKRDTNAWVYYTASGGNTALTITSDTPSGTADPPPTSTGESAQMRLFIGRENSATQQPAIGPFTASVANSEWEWVYLRRVHLPPSSTPGVAGMTDWTLVLQGRADTSVQLDADAILLLPADENSTVDACYPPKNLTTPHEWHVWATPQGVPGGYLTDGTDEAGNLRVRGVPSIGPGDTTMTFVPSVAGGISNVEDVEFDVQIYVWPRYEWLAGEV